MDKKDTNNWLFKIGSFAMSVALMVSSWFLNQAWTRIENIEKDIHELQIKDAGSSNTKFTSMDWQNQKILLDSERMAMDRRLIRLEESLPSIKESLQEIKNTLNKQNN